MLVAVRGYGHLVAYLMGWVAVERELLAAAFLVVFCTERWTGSRRMHYLMKRREFLSDLWAPSGEAQMQGLFV